MSDSNKIIKFSPQNDLVKAKEAADKLIDIVNKNKWSIKLGQGEHLMYEAWQTVGKFYNVTVATGDIIPVQLGAISGFKAKGWVIDNVTGLKVGEAEAFCMRDEYNWKAKPTFQLASMAQTRAGSKALRQMFGFVVALAGYNPTPAEEMVAVPVKELPKPEPKPEVIEEPEVIEGDPPKEQTLITNNQKLEIMKLLTKKGKTIKDLDKVVESRGKTYMKELTEVEGEAMIKKLESLPDVN